MNWKDVNSIGNAAAVALEITKPKLNLSNLQALSKLTFRILKNVCNQDLCCQELDIENILWKIFSAVEFELGNVIAIQKFRDSVSRIKSNALNANNSQIRISKDNSNCKLACKLDTLKSIIINYTKNGTLNEKFPLPKYDKKNPIENRTASIRNNVSFKLPKTPD
ncbi:hypothetical protein CEXT_194231 [Caerostris extrusa]|uniref:Uncharacterized protein n=1 Tax=Caerostris extrusa TaxID=172846 RepID=A0AAV4MM44_CAEEX|nr:hypothetical protein CEXT_194231 [Caerostris extrusa]